MMQCAETPTLGLQNFDHMSTVLDALNHAPIRSRGADFTRVREYFLDGHQRVFRQNIVLSAHLTPEANSVISRFSHNVRGTVKLEEEHKGSLRRVLPSMQIRQFYHRLPDCASLSDQDDKRFEFFRDHVLSKIGAKQQAHTMIFCSSYIEYIRIRNHFNKTEASFGGCSEYASVSSVARARSIA